MVDDVVGDILSHLNYRCPHQCLLICFDNYFFVSQGIFRLLTNFCLWKLLPLHQILDLLYFVGKFILWSVKMTVTYFSYKALIGGSQFGILGKHLVDMNSNLSSCSNTLWILSYTNNYNLETLSTLFIIGNDSSYLYINPLYILCLKNLNNASWSFTSTKSPILNSYSCFSISTYIFIFLVTFSKLTWVIFVFLYQSFISDILMGYS